MANTYTLIASNTLSSSAASVTFSAIPNTYTDLVLKISARNSAASGARIMTLTINNDSTAIYSFTRLRGNGSAASSGNATANNYAVSNWLDIATDTSNTFTSVEIYIPNYNASQNRQISSFGASENNGTTAYIEALANLYTSTTAISTLTVGNTADSFVSGSSFFLYGIQSQP